MEELVLYLARSLVDHPDQVKVTATEGPDAVILELNVAAEDMGKVRSKDPISIAARKLSGISLMDDILDNFI